MSGTYEAVIVVVEGRKEKRLTDKSRHLMPLFAFEAIGIQPGNDSLTQCKWNPGTLVFLLLMGIWKPE